MTRTFIALELNPAQQRYLAEVIRQVARLLPSVRFVDPSGIHLTLAFLGELDDSQLSHAISATSQTAQQSHSFHYRLSRVGVFGPPRSPRVIWMGIEEPTGSLTRLHRLLNQQLEQRGFSPETRPFSPHLTLARVKQSLTPTEQQSLQSLLANSQSTLPSSTSYPVNSLHVIKSELQRSGAHYTLLQACPFPS